MPTVKPSAKVLELRKRVVRGGNMDSSQFISWLDGIDSANAAMKLRKNG